jgi:hypothetical protein
MPFLVAFSDGDPVTSAIAPVLRRIHARRGGSASTGAVTAPAKSSCEVGLA